MTKKELEAKIKSLEEAISTLQAQMLTLALRSAAPYFIPNPLPPAAPYIPPYMPSYPNTTPMPWQEPYTTVTCGSLTSIADQRFQNTQILN